MQRLFCQLVQQCQATSGFGPPATRKLAHPNGATSGLVDHLIGDRPGQGADRLTGRAMARQNCQRAAWRRVTSYLPCHLHQLAAVHKPAQGLIHRVPLAERQELLGSQKASHGPAARCLQDVGTEGVMAVPVCRLVH